MSRRLSFWGLAVAAALVGYVFLQFVQPFVLPLFMAGVIALLFRPLFHWLISMCRGHRRIAAALTTIAILLAVILPIGGALYLAGRELFQYATQLQQKMNVENQGDLRNAIFSRLDDFLSAEHVERIREESSEVLRGAARDIYGRTEAFVANAMGFLVSIGILVLGVYFFLADGHQFLERTIVLMPIEERDLRTVFEEFQLVCRSVVLATVVAALVQSLLLGMGLFVVGIEAVWLLAGLTMIVSMIPLVGSAGVYLPVAIWLFFQDRYAAAIGTALYGTLIVSSADNLVRAYLIHGKSRMHPLIVLVTVLGAVREIGLWGLFIGPSIAAVLYALLKILHDRLDTGKEVAQPLAAAASEGNVEG